MTILELCTWIQNTPIATAVRESAILFPWIEGLHVIGAACVFGFISVIDFRLLGILSKDQAVSRLTDELVPWVWGAFALSLITGALLFASSAIQYSTNALFLTKMALLVSAGFNMLIFHVLTYRGVARWDVALPPPMPARIAGGASLLLWLAVIGVGRWIGFTLS
jgi:hypothetical protein